MATHITSDTEAQKATSAAPSERLVRASIAAGFAMAEGLPHDPDGERTESTIRRTWNTLEHFLAHFLSGAPGRPSGLNAS